MANRDVAAIMRAEHERVNDLMGRLKQRICAVPRHNRNDWLQTLRAEFSRFRAHLKEHFTAEEEGGFMTPVLDRRPTLTPEVEHLKHEHVELVCMLDMVSDELARIGVEDNLLLDDVCHRIQHLVKALEHHEGQEELMVSFVFSQDLGAHD